MEYRLEYCKAVPNPKQRGVWIAPGPSYGSLQRALEALEAVTTMDREAGVLWRVVGREVGEWKQLGLTC